MANLNGKDNTFTLKDFLYKEIQKDWPGYTEGDQQLLKRILFRYVRDVNLLTRMSLSSVDDFSSAINVDELNSYFKNIEYMLSEEFFLKIGVMCNVLLGVMLISA